MTSLKLFLVAGLLATLPYRNPVLGPGLPAEIADPFVLKFNGEYYLYSSGNPVNAWRSTDLVHWSPIGEVLRTSTAPGAWNGLDLWAPEVTYRNGRFYLYYTATVNDPDWKVQEAQRRVGVAVADRPEGPFIDSGHPVSSGWAIDGDVFHDPDTDKDWLFYSYVDEKTLHGAGLAVEQLLAPDRADGHPRVVLQGSEPWEDKDGNPDNGTLRYTNEGPTALKHDGTYYLMYSGGSWDLPTYSLAVAQSDTIDRPYHKQSPVLLHTTRFVEGPGHNAVVKGPNNVDDVCLYHARVYPFLDGWNRQLFVDRVYWNHGRMSMDQPTVGFHEALDRPQFEDRFDHEGPLQAPWTVVGGHWTVRQGHLVGRGRCSAGPSYSYAVYEVNVRPGAGQGGAFLGPVSVLIGKGRLHVHGPGVDATLSLPNGFAPQAWHQLLLSRSGQELNIMLDQTNVWHGTFGAWGTSSLGLTSDTADVAFDGIAVTHAWRGRSSVPDDPTPAFEFSTTVQWNKADSRIGLGVRDAHHVVTGTFDRAIWPFARFYASVDSQVVATAPLPRGFLYDQPHTLRVTKTSTGCTFRLDDADLLAVRVPLDAAVPTLVAGSFAEAAFKETTSSNLLLNGGFETEQWADNGQAAPGNPWQTEGGARAALSGLSGVRRLVIAGAAGHARQAVSGLTPGQYVLRGMVHVHGAGQARVAVGDHAIDLRVAPDDWQPFELAFETHSDAAVIDLSATPGESAVVSFDDVSLSTH